MAMEPNCGAVRWESPPLYLPMGVRAMETMTACDLLIVDLHILQKADLGSLLLWVVAGTWGQS